ncbi:SPOR domain-containing protein [Pontibacter sp. JAM-7]|uniref:SPOR domain-containing protein n=1 Tax=Pontibacter sp. JAM-7 TaxID=3366581 RepID=UPI003AF5A775
MQQQIKYRLVGFAVILVSSAILFPLLFSGAGYEERHLVSQIPEAPQRPEVFKIEPQSKALPDTTEPGAANTAVGLPQVPEHVAKALTDAKQQPELDLRDDQPVLDQQGVPVSWTLQLASFKDESNARSLRRQLINEGYKVFTRKQGELVKVYVGPEMQRSRLEGLKAQLQKDMGLDGIIVRFTTQ